MQIKALTIKWTNGIPRWVSIDIIDRYTLINTQLTLNQLSVRRLISADTPLRIDPNTWVGWHLADYQSSVDHNIDWVSPKFWSMVDWQYLSTLNRRCLWMDTHVQLCCANKHWNERTCKTSDYSSIVQSSIFQDHS